MNDSNEDPILYLRLYRNRCSDPNQIKILDLYINLLETVYPSLMKGPLKFLAVNKLMESLSLMFVATAKPDMRPERMNLAKPKPPIKCSGHKLKPVDKDVSFGFICEPCAEAKGGTWPQGHLATWHMGNCLYCGAWRGLCSVGDWNWGPYSSKPLHTSGRD